MSVERSNHYVTISGISFEGIIHIPNPAFKLYSPRTMNLTDTSERLFPDKSNVFFIHQPKQSLQSQQSNISNQSQSSLQQLSNQAQQAPQTSLRQFSQPAQSSETISSNQSQQSSSQLFRPVIQNTYSDIYQFMYSCRASKRTNNFYYLGTIDNHKTFEEIKEILSQKKTYNIVSGEQLPTNITNEEKKIIAKYLMEGLHTFWLFTNASMNDTKNITVNGQRKVVSNKVHIFKKGDDWALNMSNIFVGILIDYYQITSGIEGVNAQLSFADDSEYRLLVYQYMKLVFLSFCRMNGANIASDEDPNLIIHLSLRIIKEYLFGKEEEEESE
jgi:hypothetical protein